MKKLLALLMALAMVFTFAACGSEDKDDDKKEEKTTVSATTDSGKTDKPVTGVNSAEDAIDEFFGSIDTLTLLELSGEDTDSLTEQDELYVAICDTIIFNSEYEVLTLDEEGDDTVYANVAIYVPNATTAMQLLQEKAAEYGATHPNLTQDEINELTLTLSEEVFASSEVDKITSETLVTVISVDGKWVVDITDELILDLIDIIFGNFTM